MTENIPVIRVSVPETEVLDQWRVSEMEDYNSGSPNFTVVYLKPCLCKCSVVSGFVKTLPP